MRKSTNPIGSNQTARYLGMGNMFLCCLRNGDSSHTDIEDIRISERDPPVGQFITYGLRQDQKLCEVLQTQNCKSIIVAPLWIDKLVNDIISRTNINALKVTESRSNWSMYHPPNFMTVHLHNFGALRRLQLLSRNETANVDGVIDTDLYSPGICDEKVIISLKDLVRQTVIVGIEQTNYFGGYGIPREPQQEKVYICDLSALQFQNEKNSGRLVLVSDNNMKTGLFDEQIFEGIVGEKKTSFELASQRPDRYVQVHSSIFGQVLFDTLAYKKFVANDVWLSGIALNQLADSNSENIVFKFLKYGSGFFAGEFGSIIEDNILGGVFEGIENLLASNPSPIRIKEIHLPFFSLKESAESKLRSLENRFKVPIRISKDDALYKPNDGCFTATTNCGDPHAVFGNEMRYSSVNAAIAQNLEGKGYNFCPLMASKMEQKYI